jgi:hypothetical protein
VVGLDKTQKTTCVNVLLSGWRKVSGGVQWLEFRSISRSRSPQRSRVLHPSAVMSSDPWLSKEK